MRSGTAYDDRLDVDTRLGTKDVFVILVRALAYIKPAWRLFALKFLLMIVDLRADPRRAAGAQGAHRHVLLGNPLAEATIAFPPFFQPFVDATIGLPPTGLLFATLGLLLALLLIFGAGSGEAEATTAFLAQGEDTATQSENMISAGWSLAGGFWGAGRSAVQHPPGAARHQRPAHAAVRAADAVPMTVLDDQRIGDSVYRTMYDAPAIQGICFDITLTPVIALLGAAASVYVVNYSFGDKVPELVWLAMATLPLTLLFTVPLAGVARRASQASRGAGSATTKPHRGEHGQHGRGAEPQRGRARTRGVRRGEQRIPTGAFGIWWRWKFGIELTAGLALLAVASWAFLLVTDRIVAGDLLPGDFLLALSLFFAVAGASMSLGRLWVDFQGNAGWGCGASSSIWTCRAMARCRGRRWATRERKGAA